MNRYFIFIVFVLMFSCDEMSTNPSDWVSNENCPPEDSYELIKGQNETCYYYDVDKNRIDVSSHCCSDI